MSPEEGCAGCGTLTDSKMGAGEIGSESRGTVIGSVLAGKGGAGMVSAIDEEAMGSGREGVGQGASSTAARDRAGGGTSAGSKAGPVTALAAAGDEIGSTTSMTVGAATCSVGG